MKQLVTIPKDELEHILKTEEIDAYFYWDYWEFAGAHFKNKDVYLIENFKGELIGNGYKIRYTYDCGYVGK